MPVDSRGADLQSPAAARSARRAPDDPYRLPRRFLSALLIFSIAGAGSELILLEHTDGVWQWVPLVSLGLGLASSGAGLFRPRRRSLRIHQLLMLAFIVSGFLGVYKHVTGNAEFEIEIYPDVEGFKLFWNALGGATPALAPAAMAQLGLLGLLTTYRHPALGRGAHKPPSEGEALR